MVRTRGQKVDLRVYHAGFRIIYDIQEELLLGDLGCSRKWEYKHLGAMGIKMKLVMSLDEVI
jgi:hypothetical protein